MASKIITIPVRGMTCASCVAHVESALKGVDGVEDVAVNLATEEVYNELSPRRRTRALLHLTR